MTDFMRAVDAEFRKTSGLSESRLYKIFYSRIHESPILVLGQNPGGETDGTDLVASDSYFENWEHDYVDFRRHPQYRLAAPMCELLKYALRTDEDELLRKIPATNLAFRRSRNTEALDISLRDAAMEAKVVLAKIIQEVNPNLLLLISKTTFDNFIKIHCEKRTVKIRPDTGVYTPNGAHKACIFSEADAFVAALGREVKLVMVGHPSKYAGRAEWPLVLERTRNVFVQEGLSIA